MSDTATQNPTATPTTPAFTLSEGAAHQSTLCVHCGLCLPACPTYTTNLNEADSPRGRIYLMRALSQGRIENTPTVQNHLDLCLDCRACEIACPSGVRYHQIIEDARAKLDPPTDARRSSSLGDRLVDFVCFSIMPHPTRLKLALLPARLLQKIRLFGPVNKLTATLLGPRMGKLTSMLPDEGPLWPANLNTTYPATGALPDGSTRRVGFLPGCVNSVLAQALNVKTIELLNHLGCDVVIPTGQGCCGAIHHHDGRHAPAAEAAKKNIDAFGGCDAVVNNIAGCGAMLKEYHELLGGDPAWADRAKAFSAKVRDIHELLVELDPPAPPNRVETTVAYHDACHLANAQRVTSPPRRLLASIPGLTLVPLRESDTCCGAAGTYNLQQPEMSAQLGNRKIENLRQTGASVCAVANIGCAMQIASEAQNAGLEIEVQHPVELLHKAYLD
ncbi:MAG: (Fe-S)-binding protein [Planctomycetota bacterium]|jgi:glycolate oxidase iron-sulfur subunit